MYPDGPERFRDAYRHLVTLFREEGATNVTWFFHADSYRQSEPWNQLHWYYPGDAYVDWVGISDYGSLASNQPIIGFSEKLAYSHVYADLAGLSRRPMGIVEMGVVDNATHAKPQWIRDAFAALRARRFPRLRAAVWWHTNSPPNDTRIDSSPAALAAFRAAIADPFFGAKPRFSGDCPTPPK
jgi:beta-mannanase